MPRGKPLSAAHKAAISAGMKRYWATKRAGGGSSGGSRTRSIGDRINAPRPIQHLETGKIISREAAAAIMFGSKAARKKTAGKKLGRRR